MPRTLGLTLYDSTPNLAVTSLAFMVVAAVVILAVRGTAVDCSQLPGSGRLPEMPNLQVCVKNPTNSEALDTASPASLLWIRETEQGLEGCYTFIFSKL